MELALSARCHQPRSLTLPTAAALTGCVHSLIGNFAELAQLLRLRKSGTVASNSLVFAIATEALASVFPEQGDVIGLRRTAFHSG
jgi:hypothetical protein